jgi:predicted TIM-barrel fold metal-dependent hydrolase
LEIIDIHPHAISHDQGRYPFAPVGGKMSVWAKERPIDGDELAAWMDTAGIRRAVIVHASTAYGYDNSYVADVIDAHRDRFRYVGAVDVMADDAAERCEYWVTQRGMAGFRIFASGSTMDATSGAWLADPKTFPAWEMAAKLGIPVCVQSRAANYPMLEVLLTRFPTVKVVLDHLAHPDVSDGAPFANAQPFFDLARYPNLYLKLTERNFWDLDRHHVSTQAFVEQTVAAYGSGRIAWGSNFPSSDGTLVELRDMALAKLAFLPASDQANIFCNTALTVYPSLQAI